jgi:hypothetical protein
MDLKKRCVEYLGKRCYDCQNSFEQYMYDIHHVDPNSKDFAFGKMNIRDWDIIKLELDKCVLLCANCHRNRHYNKNNPNYCAHV